VKVIRDDVKVIFDLFRKNTSSEKYLNFNFHHLISDNKEGLIIEIVNKLIDSTFAFHLNIRQMMNILLLNNCLINFIFKIINNRVKYHITLYLFY